MTDVIILAAGSVKNKLHFARFIFDSPALVPINVRSSVSYILDFYAGHDVKVHLAVNEDDKETVFRELNYYKDVNIIGISNSSSVIETVAKAMDIIKPENDVIVNVVTTIPTVFLEQDAIFISEELTYNAEWSGIVIDQDFPEYIYRAQEKQVQCHAFSGLFRCSAKSLKDALGEPHSILDLMSVVETINKKNKVKFITGEWVDCGHELNFYDAKAKLISSRSFNSIQIDSVSGIISKSSLNVKKFCDEIRYVELLPKDIAIFFPSLIGDVSIKDDKATAKMEYYGYSTIAEYMLYWKLHNYVWDKIFNSLLSVIGKFGSYRYSIGRMAYLDFYYEKTISRVDQFKTQLEADSGLFDDYIIINGKKRKNMNLLKDAVLKKIDSLYDEKDFCVMHGDLCFNNILYDIKSGIIRLIDARGSFGDACVGIYGDIKYDLAKLTHSVNGGYDFIVNNLFYLESDGNSFTYRITTRDNFEYLQYLNKKLVEEAGYHFNDIVFLTGLLFVSMCPLHSDDRERQTLMYLHGIDYLNETLEQQ